MAQKRSRSALRRLAVVLAVLVGFMVYAYGWEVTDISLEETQEATRQASMTRALRELLSPNLFDQERESESITTRFQIGDCDTLQVEPEAPETGAPHVVFEPACVDDGEQVVAHGTNFHPNAVGQIRLVRGSGQAQPFPLMSDMLSDEEEAEAAETSIFNIGGQGSFTVDLIAPRARGGPVYNVEVVVSWPVGPPYLSDATYSVIAKMIETIFLALMATTLALPVAASLSFLAARNLMRQVRTSLGGVLISVIFLPIGWLLGSALLGPFGRLATDWGERVVPGIVGAVVVILGYVMLVRALGWQAAEAISTANRLRLIAFNILLLAVIVFVLGTVGGLGVRFGDAFAQTNLNYAALEEGESYTLQAFLEDALHYPANVVGTLGRLIELSITAIAGIGGAFVISSAVANLVNEPIRNLSPPSSHILGAVLGLLGGGILLALTALVGQLAALLSLFSPLVAGVLGGEIATQLYKRVADGEFGKTQRNILRGIYGIGAVVAFVLVYATLDLSRAVVNGRLPVGVMWSVAGITIDAYIGKAAIIGAVLGMIGGGLVGTGATFPLGMVVYNTTRTMLNTLRSIEPLIMGIVFVIWVGVGPFAGVLALTLHSIAALGKLYSEQIENIDDGPIEAVQATGANRLQTIVYAVVPQIIPPYVAFTMYRWDINVRMSTIIGFVGGGGIGFLLQQQINLLRYRDAGVAVLAIAIVVSVLDYTSATIRERMV